MGKYAQIDNNILAVFGTSRWNAENIKTYPENFIKVGTSDEFIRVSIVTSGNGVNLKSVSGILLIDIFTKVGDGPKRSSTIADKLDSHLSGKSLSAVAGTVVQFQSSTVGRGKNDIDNSALYHKTYTIPFNYFEVS
jgi:hypothetical protein